MNASNVRALVELVREGYEAHLRTQHPPGWTPDQRTLDIYCLGRWLQEHLTATGMDNEERILLQWHFNRTVRAEDDPFLAMERTLACIDAGIPDVYTRFRRKR